MAKVWVDDRCAVCGHPVRDGEEAVLAALVTVTSSWTYGAAHGVDGAPHQVRPLFRKQKRRLWHLACSPCEVDTTLELPK